RQPFRKITDKLNSRRTAPIADTPGRNELRISADRNPCPHVPGCLWRGLGEHDVALLGINEAPDLIELDALAGQVAEHLVLIGRARLAGIDRQLVYGVDRNVSYATGRTKTVSLDQQIEDMSALGNGQPV